MSADFLEEAVTFFSLVSCFEKLQTHFWIFWKKQYHFFPLCPALNNYNRIKFYMQWGIETQKNHLHFVSFSRPVQVISISL